MRIWQLNRKAILLQYKKNKHLKTIMLECGYLEMFEINYNLLSNSRITKDLGGTYKRI
jgi:hypothetical protein